MNKPTEWMQRYNAMMTQRNEMLGMMDKFPEMCRSFVSSVVSLSATTGEAFPLHELMKDSPADVEIVVNECRLIFDPDQMLGCYKIMRRGEVLATIPDVENVVSFNQALQELIKHGAE